MNRPMRPLPADSITHHRSGPLSLPRLVLSPPQSPAKLSRRQFVAGVVAASGAAVAARALGGESWRWQIGCYTRPWAAYDYRVALDGIAAAGFKYVGLMTAKSKDNLIVSVTTTPEEAAAVGAEVKRRGLKVISLWGGQFPTDSPGGTETPHRQLRRLRLPAPDARRHVGETRNRRTTRSSPTAATTPWPKAWGSASSRTADPTPAARSAARSSTGSATRTSASGTTPGTYSSTPTANSTPWTTPRQSMAW